MEEIDPANLNRELLAHLFRQYADASVADKLDRVTFESDNLSPKTADPNASLDDFAPCHIERPDDVRDLFVPRFFFGCEADDPTNAWAFYQRANPFGARLGAVFGSDIGHFDVPDMTAVLHEAYEMVDDGLINEADFRDFVFANPVRLWAGNNRDFFRGTLVEEHAKKVLLG